MVFTSVDVTEAAGNGFQQCLGICHIVVTVERTLRSHITQSQNWTVVGNGVEFLGSLYHLVERDSGDVQRLFQHIVIQIIICTFLTHIGRHTNGVQHEVNRATQYFHRAFEYIFQIFYTCSICGNHLAVQFLRKSGHFAHTDSNRCIR